MKSSATIETSQTSELLIVIFGIPHSLAVRTVRSTKAIVQCK